MIREEDPFSPALNYGDSATKSAVDPVSSITTLSSFLQITCRRQERLLTLPKAFLRVFRSAAQSEAKLAIEIDGQDEEGAFSLEGGAFSTVVAGGPWKPDDTRRRRSSSGSAPRGAD